MALTGKKRAFADALKAGKSNKDAAIAAGYSAKTASPAGSRMAKDKDVVAFLAGKPVLVADVLTTQRDGTKHPDAPPNWPFGTEPPKVDGQAVDLPRKRLTAREYLEQLVNDEEADDKLRLDAAKRLIEFQEPKPVALGKKEAKDQAAGRVAGKFSAAAPPKLVAAGGKKV